jgi:inhibitor of cysteine peptidase
MVKRLIGLFSVMILALAIIVGCDSSSGNHDISGTVTDSGSGLEGVLMTMDNGDTTTTDSSGDYKFSGLPDGSYTITPSLSGDSFNPASLTVALAGADLTDINFTTGSGGITYAISGTVTDSGTLLGLAGVTMTLSGGANTTVTTDSSGNYSFTGLSNGSFTITPSLTGYSFSPTSQAVTINGADDTAVDFTASP